MEGMTKGDNSVENNEKNRDVFKKLEELRSQIEDELAYTIGRFVASEMSYSGEEYKEENKKVIFSHGHGSSEFVVQYGNYPEKPITMFHLNQELLGGLLEKIRTGEIKLPPVGQVVLPSTITR